MIKSILSVNLKYASLLFFSIEETEITNLMAVLLKTKIEQNKNRGNAVDKSSKNIPIRNEIREPARNHETII